MTREGPGLWIPDDILDALLPLGHRAVACYCLLGRCTQLRDYPSIEDLSRRLLLRSYQGWKLLLQLYEKGLINQADFEAVQAATRGDVTAD